jgi:hypothetical protein
MGIFRGCTYQPYILLQRRKFRVVSPAIETLIPSFTRCCAGIPPGFLASGWPWAAVVPYNARALSLSVFTPFPSLYKSPRDVPERTDWGTAEPAVGHSHDDGSLPPH